MKHLTHLRKFKTDNSCEIGVEIGNVVDSNGKKVKYKLGGIVYGAGLGELIDIYIDLKSKPKFIMSGYKKSELNRTIDHIKTMLNNCFVEWSDVE